MTNDLTVIIFQRKNQRKEPAKSNTQTGDSGKNWGNPNKLKASKAVQEKVRDQRKKSKEVMKNLNKIKQDSVTTMSRIKGSPTSMKSKIR